MKLFHGRLLRVKQFLFDKYYKLRKTGSEYYCIVYVLQN